MGHEVGLDCSVFLDRLGIPDRGTRGGGGGWGVTAVCFGPIKDPGDVRRGGGRLQCVFGRLRIRGRETRGGMTAVCVGPVKDSRPWDARWTETTVGLGPRKGKTSKTLRSRPSGHPASVVGVSPVVTHGVTCTRITKCFGRGGWVQSRVPTDTPLEARG